MFHRALDADRTTDHPTREASDHANLDPRNVMLRCGSCHTIKSNAERARRMAAQPAVRG